MSVSSGRIRRARESVGIPRRGASERAGLSTDGTRIMAGCPPGSWPQFVGFSGNLTVLRVYCVFSSLSARWEKVKLIQHFE